MTGMEQGLYYIEREIRFMVKDQFGNMSNVKYADRVIEDTCGVSGFCTAVLSSKRPLAAILRAVRGSKGDLLMRFFNASLHDTRVEMVMVLAEATKIRARKNHETKNSHEYLLRLYKKAVKRMIRLVTGSKSKETYKSMYRGLRGFVKVDDLDYEDDDYDLEDEEFGSDMEFGDSEYAEACLDAFRSGITPPGINRKKVNPKYLNPGFAGNEEILREIAAIEAKLGRQLTDAELDDIICGDDDEDDLDYPSMNITNLQQDSEEMMDSIVNAIFSRVMEKFANAQKPGPYYESLDEFVERAKTPEPEPDPAQKDIARKVPETISETTSTKDLIGLRNQLKNEVPSHKDSEQNESPETSNEEESGDESSRLAPNDELGANAYDEEDLIEVMNEDDDAPEEVKEEDSSNEESTTTSTGELIASEEALSAEEENELILADILRDFDLYESELIQTLINRFTNYLNTLSIELTDASIHLVPSKDPNHLFTLISTLRVIGDMEIINHIHLSTVVNLFAKTLAQRFEIPEDLIDTELNVVYTDETFTNDLQVLNKNGKDFDQESVSQLYNALCVICAFSYNRLGKLIDIKFINDPKTTQVNLFFNSKSDDLSIEGLKTFVENEIGDIHLSKILQYFNVSRNYHWNTYFGRDDLFFEMLSKAATIDIVEPYGTINVDAIQYNLEEYYDMPAEVEVSITPAATQTSVVLDMIYTARTTKAVGAETRADIERTMYENGEYKVRPEGVLRAISMNIEISPYIKYILDEGEVPEEEDTSEKTSNFGI